MRQLVQRIEFFYAIGSRYSYLTVSKLGRLASEAGASIEWLPLNSVRLLHERGYSPFEHAELVRGQYSADYRERDAKRWAELYGLPFIEPRGRIELDSELLALAATAGKWLGAAEALSNALFAAVFHGHVGQLDDKECARQAASVGIEPRRFESALRSDEVADLLDETMLRAHVAGVFGVPTFIVGDEQFWGNDRLPLLAQHLQRAR